MSSSILEWCHHCDTLLFQSIFHRKGHHSLRTLLYWTSRSADGPLYFLLALLVLLSPSPRGASFFVTALAAFCVEVPLYQVLKNTFKRQRPYRQLADVQRSIVPPDEFSFPSGHTAGAFLMATILGSVFPALRLSAYIWAGGVGYSRVYNGVHFPADVFAGAGLGYFCAQASLLAFRLFV